MKCPYCGGDNAADAGFCERCGSRLTAAAPINIVVAKRAPRASHRAAGGVRFFVVVLICVLAAAAGFLTFKALQPPKYIFQQHLITFIWDGKQTTVFYDTTAVGTLGAKFSSSAQSDFTGARAAALSDDGGLYYADRQGVYKIADDVQSYNTASSGNGVVYLGTDGTLTLYSVKSRKAEKIADDVTKDPAAVYLLFTISPDGKTVLYSKGGTLYVYAKGQSVFIGTDLAGLAVSNGGKYIYSCAYNVGTLYVSQLGGDLKKLSDGYGQASPFFCADNTQMLYYADGANYISVNGGYGMKVAGGNIAAPLLPNSAVAVSSLMNVVYADQTYANNNGHVYFINGKGGTVTFPRYCQGGTLDGTGETLYYLNSADNNFYKCAVKDPVNSVEIGQNIAGWCYVSPKDRHVYYVDSNNELWCKTGDADAVKIGDGVYGPSGMSAGGTLIFTAQYGSGLVCTCSDGRTAVTLSSDACGAVAIGSVMLYMDNYDSATVTYDVYGGTGGKFVPMASGVQLIAFATYDGSNVQW